MHKKKVAIIGAGASGLAAIKCCIEEGLEPVCFERSGHFAGLWYYTEDVTDGQACVASTTVVNTAKETMCFSDFPMPKEFPNYAHHTKVLQYIQMYVKEFGLEKFIHFNTEIRLVAKTDNFSQSGQWNLDICDMDINQTKTETFDAVMICTGNHACKFMPRFHGDDVFEGDILHSHQYRNEKGFENKRVVIVGFGNSAVDAAVDLSRVAREVYLSTRHGGWMVSRVGSWGVPLSHEFMCRAKFFLIDLLPGWIRETIAQRRFNQKFDHATYGLKSKFGISAQRLVVNDDLPSRIISGQVIVKPDVKRLSKSGVVFEDGSVVEDVDVIMLATGYEFGFPFQEQGVLAEAKTQADLYKYVFPPHLEHPTIAVIGFIQALGAIVPLSELQCRWAARVFKGPAKLPGYDEMMDDINRKREAMAQRCVASSRPDVRVDVISYMDELAEQFGAKPKLTTLLLRDPKLALAVIFGLWAPYQYRLTGPGQWPGAREAILTIWDRVLAPFQTRKVEETRRRDNGKAMGLLAVIIVGIAICVASFVC